MKKRLLYVFFFLTLFSCVTTKVTTPEEPLEIPVLDYGEFELIDVDDNSFALQLFTNKMPQNTAWVELIYNYIHYGVYLPNQKIYVPKTEEDEYVILLFKDVTNNLVAVKYYDITLF